MSEKKNTATLHFLLVLTYITVVLNMFSYFFMALLLPDVKQMYDANPDLVPEQTRTMFDTVLGLPRGFFAVTALLYAVEMAGAVLMGRLRRLGFHCYTVARLLLLLVPVLFVGRDMLGIGNIMFALLFITAYYLVLHSLGVFSTGEDTATEQ